MQNVLSAPRACGACRGASSAPSRRARPRHRKLRNGMSRAQFPFEEQILTRALGTAGEPTGEHIINTTQGVSFLLRTVACCLGCRRRAGPWHQQSTNQRRADFNVERTSTPGVRPCEMAAYPGSVECALGFLLLDEGIPRSVEIDPSRKQSGTTTVEQFLNIAAVEHSSAVDKFDRTLEKSTPPASMLCRADTDTNSAPNPLLDFGITRPPFSDTSPGLLVGPTLAHTR